MPRGVHKNKVKKRYIVEVGVAIEGGTWTLVDGTVKSANMTNAEKAGLAKVKKGFKDAPLNIVAFFIYNVREAGDDAE